MVQVLRLVWQAIFAVPAQPFMCCCLLLTAHFTFVQHAPILQAAAMPPPPANIKPGQPPVRLQPAAAMGPPAVPATPVPTAAAPGASALPAGLPTAFFDDKAADAKARGIKM
jgi:hypothetical protein